MGRNTRNQNHIVTEGFSSEETERIYQKIDRGDAPLAQQYREGRQCCVCNFFAPLNADWGICCYKRSPHYLETIFEHFACLAYVPWEEGDGRSHTFSDYYVRSFKSG